MTAQRIVAAPATTSWTVGSRAGILRSLPASMLEQTCRRVAVASLVFAGLWGFALLMNNFFYRLVMGQPLPVSGTWPWPGNLIGAAGVILSLAMFGAARRLRVRPELLLDMGLGFEVASAFLLGLMNHWTPPNAAHMGVSWICVVVLVYPAIVPAPTGRTLLAAVAVASMDPVGMLIGLGRGVAYPLSSFDLAWLFLPNYVCALLAVVPAHVIRGLGRQVSRARELGSYRLVERLGHGGMGEVHRATHRMLARPAAIKLIRPEVLGAGSPEAANIIVERFRREAEAAATLRSPHTIELYDFGLTDDGTFYYVMELLEGLNLQELVERFGPVPVERAVHLLRQACLSLAEAHDRGLVHRDIKPSNLVTSRMGLTVDFLKILDFGLVKAQRPDGRDQILLTSPDVTTGTPAFMSPELAVGDRPVDRRADIYALGCVAYWLLTGQFVFDGANSVAVLMRHVQDEPLAPSARSELPVPPEMDALVLACLAKDPAERPQDALELARRLADFPLSDAWTDERALDWWRLHLPELFPDGPATLLGRGGDGPQAERLTVIKEE